jgi:hypothetical protein
MLKGMPMAAPNLPISPGHRSPISKDSSVPETAPTATSTAMAFDHRRASNRASLSPCLRPSQWAIMITAGRAIPKQAKTIWKERVSPIWLRASAIEAGVRAPNVTAFGLPEPSCYCEAESSDDRHSQTSSFPSRNKNSVRPRK